MEYKVYKNLIFDLDDTIVNCGIYYAECKKRFVDYASGRTNLPSEFVQKLLESIDLCCISLPNAFGQTRFATSNAATSMALDIISGRDCDEYAKKISYDIGFSVFDAEYAPVSGAIDTLQYYHDKGYNLYLYTKGDFVIQMKKIDKNNLGRFFHLDNIHVVSNKSANVLNGIIIDHDLDINETLLIGDSLRDDIGSANGVRIDSVWINNTEKPSWGYENVLEVPTYSIRTLSDLPSLIK